MFLDEKLGEIYDKFLPNAEAVNFTKIDLTVRSILSALTSELLSPKDEQAYLIALKRANNSFKLFRKQNDRFGIFKENAFELFCWNRIKHKFDVAKLIFKRLGRKIPSDVRKS